MVLLCRI